MLKLSKTGIKELSKRYRLVLIASIVAFGTAIPSADASTFDPSKSVQENYIAFKTAISGSGTFEARGYVIDQAFAQEHPQITRQVLGAIMTESSDSTVDGKPNYTVMASAVDDFTTLTGAVISRDVLGIDASDPDFDTVYASTNHLQQATTLADADVKLDTAIKANTDAIAQNEAAIQTNAGAIAQNATNIQANTDAIAQNTTALGDVAALSETGRYARYTNVADNLSALDSALSDVDSRVRRLDRQMKGGFASMAALSALQPNARASSDTQLSIGTGTYRGRVGMALGAFHYINDNAMLNLGASYAGSTSATFRAGVTLGW